MAIETLRCDEKLFEKDLSKKIMIVTGANSGVGFETTKQLVKQGAHVVMGCRRIDAAKEVAKELDGLKGSYDILKLDLSDLQSVRDFADEFRAKYKRLDVLDCNAGAVMNGKERQVSKDGFEMTFAVNFLGHFLLTETLLDMLKESAPSRILLLSSVVHAGSKKNRHEIHLDDLNFENRPYTNFKAYSEAKLAAILYMKELADHLKDTKVTTYSVHPGWAKSAFGGNGALMKASRVLLKPFEKQLTMMNSFDAAQASLHCILSDDAPKHSGEYFSQNSILYSDKECRKGGFPMKSPNPNADDMDTAKKLVDLSNKLVGLEA